MRAFIASLIFRPLPLTKSLARSFHWYLAMIINPHALLRPPPPPVAPEPPRQSARTKRAAPASDAVEEPRGDVRSPHFRLPKALREGQKGLSDVPRDIDNGTSASDGEDTPGAEANEADDSAETARRITEQLKANGDEEATSQNLRELTLEESPELQSRNGRASQVDGDPMEVDEHDKRAIAGGVIEEGDDEEMIFEDARGTLEGGGSRKIDQSPSPSKRHMRWGDDEAAGPSDAVAQGSPDVEIIKGQSTDLPDRAASPAPIGPAASQEMKRLLQQELFPDTESTGAPLPEDGGEEAEPAVVLSSGTIKGDEGDDDDEIEVIASAAKAGPAGARPEGSQAPPQASKIGNMTNGRGQTFAPADPEPDRQEQIRRDREEARRLERQEAEEQAEAAKQRRLLRLEQAKAETDIDG